MAFRDTSYDKPSHDSGTPRRESRSEPLPQPRTRTASDASSINPADRAPIDPRMPHLPPA